MYDERPGRDELNVNLAAAIETLREEREPAMEAECLGTQTVQEG